MKMEDQFFKRRKHAAKGVTKSNHAMKREAAKTMKNFICKILAISVLFSLCAGFNATSASAATNGLQGDGLYTLSPACAPKTCLDVSGGSTQDNANLQIYSANGTAAQQFYLTSCGGGYYIMTAKVSGKVVNVKGSSTKSGANVVQYKYQNGANQFWLIKSAGNGYYYICPSNNTKLALDVSGGGSSSGNNVQVYTANGTNAQKWKLTRISSSLKGSTISSIKKTTSSPAAAFSVKASGNSSSKVKIDIGNTALTSSRISLVSSATVSVRIVSSSGKVITNTTFRGKSKTFTISSSYPSYTVYISKYVWSGNNLITKSIAGGNNFTNLGNYCQISLTGATLAT